MKMLCGSRDDAILYGSLDKYDIYAKQKEWRICWLPETNNYAPKILRVGDLRDIIEIVPVSELEKKLLSIFPGYFLGYVDKTRKRCMGTMSYRDFKRRVESIDGKCRLILDIG
jgi:hypothetical protein